MKIAASDGPWSLHPGETSVVSADGRIVASCGFLPGVSAFEAKANARLIAAAKDMELALRELAQWYESEIGLPACKANEALKKASVSGGSA